VSAGAISEATRNREAIRDWKAGLSQCEPAAPFPLRKGASQLCGEKIAI